MKWQKGMCENRGVTTRTLNLIDDHRRLHLQQSEVEPTLVCVLLLVQDRPVAGAHADVETRSRMT